MREGRCRQRLSREEDCAAAWGEEPAAPRLLANPDPNISPPRRRQMEEREGVAMEEERGGDRPPSARAREGVAAGDGERAPLWPEMLWEGVGRTEGVRGTGKAVFPLPAVGDGVFCLPIQPLCAMHMNQCLSHFARLVGASLRPLPIETKAPHSTMWMRRGL